MGDRNTITAAERSRSGEKTLFWGCFIALVATAFAFIIRVMLMNEWQIEFGLSETEKGQIFGAGLWPFGISIVLFSLIIDRIGYGRAMVFAFVCHVASAVLMVFAEGYWSLWIGSVLNGLAAGTVEAVINPVVATMYRKNKTKMLTILHAGWPGGFVLGGLLILGMGALGKLGDEGVLIFGMNAAALAGWRVQVGIILIPTMIYGLVLLRCKFPPNERVAAGVPYKDMLKECGALGALIVVYMIMMEVGRVFELPRPVSYGVVLAAVLAVGLYTRAFGKFMYTFLLLVMILLAITELGTDAWIKELMKPGMDAIKIDAGWIIIYTATIMMVLRFCIGPIVKVLKPLGVLLVSSLFAAGGLLLLSGAREGWILIAATVYGTGQTFFWPVTIGLCSEQFPRGGALTINAIAGVGMLGVGIIGTPMLGFMQDTHIEKTLEPAAYERVSEPDDKMSVLGKYRALDTKKVAKLNAQVDLYKREGAVSKRLKPDSDLTLALARDREYGKLVTNAYNQAVREKGDRGEKTFEEMHAALRKEGFLVSETEHAARSAELKTLNEKVNGAKRIAMAWIAILPVIMAVCYIGLMIYFKRKGGYKAIDLSAGGKEAGGHDVTPEEPVADADAEASPSE